MQISTVNQISFATFEDLTLAHETGLKINLNTQLRGCIEPYSGEDEEATPVVVHARDGNDYLIVGWEGNGYTLFVVDNEPANPQELGAQELGAVIIVARFETVREALAEMTNIILTDCGG